MAVKLDRLITTKTKLNTRPLDHIYDGNFVVSDKRDFQRASIASAASEAEYKICPIFRTMFSDAYPRIKIVLSRINRVPPWIDTSWEARQLSYKMPSKRTKTFDIGGKDRHRFFRRPVVPYLQPSGTSVHFTDTDTELEQDIVYGTQNNATQTDYRESETQTSPWAPPVLCNSTSPPEILTLASLSWENGLPAGMHEVEIIERARKKRAWEKLLPTSGDKKSIELMRHMIDTMERDEWLFREAEIETINKMRLELSQKLLQQIQQEESNKLNDRVQRYWLSKQQEKNKKIQKIRNNCSRELRKLALRHKNIQMKYHEMDIVEEHRDRKSELYGPQMRYGEHPKRSHEIIKVRSRFLTHVKGLEILETIPRKKHASEHLTNLPVRKVYELCVRETRWTEDELTQLHKDLKDISEGKSEESGPLRLVFRAPKPIEELKIPGTKGVQDEEEQIYQSSVFLQKIIKGRAIQTLMCKGRRKYQELIEEIKSTTALQQADVMHITQQRDEAESLLREQVLQKRQDDRVKEIMSFFKGQTISSTLDFLSKELWRLQDERRIHAFVMLAERLRYKREAAEAGRRQVEERRRREHDEIFKQLVKVHQDTVDMYLEDLVMESMDWVAEAEARHHVRDVAQKIDKAAEQVTLRQNCLEQEELVADLIHNFVVPEVQKQIIRKQIKQKQAKYLQEAHACIYNEVENLPPVEHLEDTNIEGDKESSGSDEAIGDMASDFVLPGKEHKKGSHIQKLTILHEEDHPSSKVESSESMKVESAESFLASESSSEIEDISHRVDSFTAHKESTQEFEDRVFKTGSKKVISDEFYHRGEEEQEEEQKEKEEKQKQVKKEEEEEEEEEGTIARSKLIAKPKISLSDKEFADLKMKHKLGFAAENKDSDGKAKMKSKPRIGFKESDEEINEETPKHHKGKQKLGFKVHDK
ncbi:hypothetical protein L9F63_018270 [Diploptera punctata]|uniref:Cilia- and flagella-associated protein 91 n=1 Tax=Diploptera punctata TaxID=6984 RepID=A0AAD8EFW7_DIPPU|nr:hypothetical protein L9F63_018270 [Diploptera punctata]